MSFFWVDSHGQFAIFSQFISYKQNSKIFNFRVLRKLKGASEMIEEKHNISWTQSHDIKYHAQMQQQAQRHEL